MRNHSQISLNYFSSLAGVFVTLCECTCVCVCVNMCMVRLVCQRGTGKSLSRNWLQSDTCCLSFTCKHTHWLSEQLESCLHLKSCLYLRRLRAAALITYWDCVCTHALTCLCTYVCVYMCLRKYRRAHGTCSGCVFWLWRADHYDGVEGQGVWSEDTDISVCLI